MTPTKVPTQTAIKAFNFDIEKNTLVVNGFSVTIIGDYETPWFSGKEMCTALGYKDTQNALFTHVKPKHKQTLSELTKLGPATCPNFVGSFEPLKNPTYHEGKAVYISEHGAYHLAMKCQLPIGGDFRDWLAEDVIPSLRKTGQYKLIKEKDDKLSESLSLLALKQDELVLKQDELVLKQDELALERKEGVKTRSMLKKTEEEKEEAVRQQLIAEQQKKVAEFRSVTLNKLCVNYQERIKTQIYYIVTSEVMARDGEFKIGGVESKSLLKKRLSMYNTGNSGVHPELVMNFVFLVEVANYKQMEMRMKELLLPFRSKKHANTENFNIHFDILKPLSEIVSENYNDEIDTLNGFLKRLLETHTEKYMTPMTIPPTINSDSIPDTLELTVTRRAFGTAKNEKTKISDLSNEELKQVIDQVLSTKWGNLIDGSIIRRSDLEKILEASFIISSHKRQIWDLAKPQIENAGKVPKY